MDHTPYTLDCLQFRDLPADMHALICNLLPSKNLLRLSLTCRTYEDFIPGDLIDTVNDTLMRGTPGDAYGYSRNKKRVFGFCRRLRLTRVRFWMIGLIMNRKVQEKILARSAETFFCAGMYVAVSNDVGARYLCGFKDLYWAGGPTEFLNRNTSLSINVYDPGLSELLQRRPLELPLIKLSNKTRLHVHNGAKSSAVVAAANSIACAILTQSRDTLEDIVLRGVKDRSVQQAVLDLVKSRWVSNRRLPHVSTDFDNHPIQNWFSGDANVVDHCEVYGTPCFLPWVLENAPPKILRWLDLASPPTLETCDLILERLHLGIKPGRCFWTDEQLANFPVTDLAELARKVIYISTVTENWAWFVFAQTSVLLALSRDSDAFTAADVGSFAMAMFSTRVRPLPLEEVPIPVITRFFVRIIERARICIEQHYVHEISYLAALVMNLGKDAFGDRSDFPRPVPDDLRIALRDLCALRRGLGLPDAFLNIWISCQALCDNLALSLSMLLVEDEEALLAPLVHHYVSISVSERAGSVVCRLQNVHKVVLAEVPGLYRAAEREIQRRITNCAGPKSTVGDLKDVLRRLLKNKSHGKTFRIKPRRSEADADAIYVD